MDKARGTTTDTDIETLALLEALRPPVESAPDMTAMVRYLCQALGVESARQVERKIVGHDRARRTLRETRSALDRLQAMPWTEVIACSKGQDLFADVARAWMALASERGAALPSARETWLVHGWRGLRHQAAAGVGEAQAAWAAFLEFGTQLKAQWAVAALAPSLTRGGAAKPTAAGAWPDDIEMIVETARIETDDTLTVSLLLRDGQGGSRTDLSGTPVVLSFQQASERWPLDVATIEGDRVAWTLPGFGRALDLPEGPLSLECLHITLGSLGLAPDHDPRPLFADLLEADGTPVPSAPVQIELWGEPHLDAGEFEVRIALPDWIRAVYPAHRLRLDGIVTEGNTQRLGMWPIADWDSSPRALRVPMPGFVPPNARLRTFVRARLQAS